MSAIVCRLGRSLARQNASSLAATAGAAARSPPMIAATIGAAGIPLDRLVGGARARRRRSRRRRPRPPGAVVDPPAAHRARRDDRRAARRRPAPSCRACSAIRSPTRRWSACRAAAALAAAATIVVGDKVLPARSPGCRSSSCRSPPSSARSRPRRCCIALPRARAAPRSPPSCSAGSPIAALANAGNRPAGVPRRRPAAARHDLLDARLAERRHLAEGRGDRAVPGAHR